MQYLRLHPPYGSRQPGRCLERAGPGPQGRGRPALPLLSLLAREFRQLWQACAGEKVRFHPSEANAKQQLARRLGPAALARCLGMIMDAELAIKSGRCTPEQSLDKLATDLVALFSAARR